MLANSSIATLGGGALLAGLLAGWEQVKGMISRITGLVVITVEVQERCSDAVRTYCWANLRRSPSPFKYYTGRFRYIRPLARYGSVAYETLGEKGQLFWKGKKPIWVTIGGSGYHDRVTFRFIRGTFDADALVHEVMTTYVQEKECAIKFDSGRPSRFRVIRLAGLSGKDALGLQNMNMGSKGAGKNNESDSPVLAGAVESVEDRLVGWDREDIGEVISATDPISRLALSPEVDEAIAEVQRWYDSKEWYTERQIPWRRGLLLYGPPGTGKSSLVKAVAQKLQLPIYLLDISTMDNQEFHRSYQQALADTPAIVLIEDIDAVFHGRENVVAEKGQGLTYDCLLNTISGVESSDGILLVITTNNLEHVDDALGRPTSGNTSSRPGRIDRAVEMSRLSRAGREKLARRILSGCHESWIPVLVDLGHEDTGAQFEDRCATSALDIYWSEDPHSVYPGNTDTNRHLLLIPRDCDPHPQALA